MAGPNYAAGRSLSGWLKTLTALKQRAFDPAIEPMAVTSGLCLFTALYYTRLLPLQILSFIILIAVTGYWAFAIRYIRPMSLRDFKLTTHRLGLNVLLAVGLAIFGWFYFSFYVYWTRGELLELGFGGSVPALLAIILVSSAEELYFRGYLQNRLGNRYRVWQRVIIAVVAMALYKNFVHMWNGLPPILQVELLLVGILHNVLPSFWMEWSGSLVGPWLLHVFWDLLVYAPLSGIPYWVY